MSAPSPSHECFHAADGVCEHPRVGGPLEPEKCARCAHYTGTPRGLGDIVATVTKATGIERVFHAVAPNCGCLKRRAALNAAFPLSDQKEEDERVPDSQRQP